MTQTRREAIVRDVVDTLENITVANGYRTTVGSVEFVLREWEDAKRSGTFPCLGVSILSESFAYMPSNIIEVSMKIGLTSHSDAPPGEDKLEALSDLQDDIIAAMHVDVTRSANATRTALVLDSTDEADPYSGSRPTGTRLMDWLITYERTTGQSP